MAHPQTTADVLVAFANALAVAEQAGPPGTPPLSQGLIAVAQSLPGGGPPLPAAVVPGVTQAAMPAGVPAVVQQFFRAPAGAPAPAAPTGPVAPVGGVATRGSL